MSSNAVDDVSKTLAETNISDDSQQKTNAGTANEADAGHAAEGKRLYVGNLAYATTEGELKAFFEGYSVESVTIPTNPRSQRPVGYAFVDVTTHADAERAINDLSGKEILQRKVSVQLARKHDSDDKGDNGEGGSGHEGERRRFGGRGRVRSRGGFRGGRRFRGPRTNDAEGGTTEGGAAEGGEEHAGEHTEVPTNVPGQVIPLTEHTDNAQTAKSETADENTSKGNRPRQYRERRNRGPPEDGIVSKTKVMVANLPYDYTEDKLRALFEGYEPTAAKIALRPIPRFMVKKLQARNEPRKGRGFGFITLASEELQQKAIQEMNGKEVEGREIAVKVAIDSPGKEDDGHGDDSQGTEQHQQQQQNDNDAQTTAA
jgi:RNA recognition motif-containing protein